MPGGGSAIVCSRGGRGKRPGKAPAPAPALPLTGGGETEHRRLERLLACVEREAGKRRRFYALWVQQGRMLPETAARGEEEWADVQACVVAALTGKPGVARHEMDRRIAVVAREIERRKRAYPNLIARGTLSVKAAERDLLEMGEVLTWMQERRNQG
jgi:hypothetical protein